MAVGETVLALVTIDYAGSGEIHTDFMVQIGGNTIFNGQISEAPDGKLKGFIYDGLKYSWTDAIWDGTVGEVIYTSDNRPYYEYIRATLAPAPVPLPAPAALLPLGIGALAMMRRRRHPA